MTQRFRRTRDGRVWPAYTGEGLDTRPVQGLFYLPSPNGPRRDSVDTIPLADALDGRGLLMFVAVADRSLRLLGDRMAQISDDNPGWTIAWLNESDEATGLSLAGRRLPRAKLDSTTQTWNGSVRGRSRVSAAEDFGIEFTHRTPTTLELAGLSDGGADDEAVLRFESLASLTLPSATAPGSGPATLDLFTETPGVFRFVADLPDSCDAEIRHSHHADHRADLQSITSAVAFTSPPGAATIRFDPAAPFDHRRTGIGFQPNVDVVSGWCTPRGKPITLQTLEGSGVVPQSAGDGSTYLTPAGPFNCRDSHKLVCGLSGAEYLQLEAGSVLSFVPGQPASSERREVADPVRTAWLSVGSESDGLAYYAQSTSSGFYGVTESGFLPHFDVTAASLTSGVAIPTMPWSGYSGPSSGTAELESRLATERFDLLLGPQANPDDGIGSEEEPHQTDVVTPSGLRATVQNGAIISLGVVKVDEDPMTIDASAMPALRAALSADEQFIVVTEPPIFRGKMADEPRLRIDGWAFDFSRDRWRRSGTTMIIKHRIDRPLAELIAKPESWTRPESLNEDPQRSANRLQRWVSETREHDDPVKQDLVRRVLDDATWQGVLFISVPAPLSGLPDDLQLLRATGSGTSDDRDAVLAHHLTVDRRPVDPDAGSSSVSGLLEYPLPGHAPPVGVRADGHEFTFTSLRVRFVDSAVAEFGATAEISLGSFLHTRLARPVLVTLAGRQERRAGHTQYSFDTEISPPQPLVVQDATIAAGRISRANVVADDGDLRFTFDGDIDFQQPAADEPDLLGYERIEFRSLDLTLQTDVDGSSQSRFAWHTDSVGLTGTQSAASLPGQFPLRPVGLLLGATSELGGRGFQTMRLPSAVTADALGDRFLGIDHELDLGSMGGLSAVPGFVANLAVCWSPDTSGRKLQLGLRFPGVDVGGGGGFSLQDIFGINCHGIALDHDDQSRAFAMRLNGLALDLLGFEIPWGGTINAELTADPNGSRTLGWLGDYRNPTESSKPDKNKQRRLPRSTNGVR